MCCPGQKVGAMPTMPWRYRRSSHLSVNAPMQPGSRWEIVMYVPASCTRSVCTMNFIGYYRCYTLSQERQRYSPSRRKVCLSELLGRGSGRAENFLKIRYEFIFCKVIIGWDPAPKRYTRGTLERPSPRAYPDQGNLLDQLRHVFRNTFRRSALISRLKT